MRTTAATISKLWDRYDDCGWFANKGTQTFKQITATNNGDKSGELESKTYVKNIKDEEL